MISRGDTRLANDTHMYLTFVSKRKMKSRDSKFTMENDSCLFPIRGSSRPPYGLKKKGISVLRYQKDEMPRKDAERVA